MILSTYDFKSFIIELILVSSFNYSLCIFSILDNLTADKFDGT
jgi:hypothetical protein